MKANPMLQIVPRPRRTRARAGTFVFNHPDLRVETPRHPPVCIAHKIRELGFHAVQRTPGDGWCVRIGAEIAAPNPPAHPEGYALRVTPDGIAVVGQDGDGLFWGLITLQQLLRASNRIPGVDIRDWPRWPLRYHHDDISRGQISTVADFKRIIRLLSYYKIKYYTPYIEDVLFLKSHPDIGKQRGRLTPTEVRAIHAEARRCNVTLFPTFSLIGHQENLLRIPRYRTYGREVFQDMSSFDPSSPALRPFLKTVIRDVCEQFPDSPFFHAGFDEVQGVEEAVITEHANWCAQEIARHGKRMIVWVDMWKNHFGLDALSRLDPSILLVEWNYTNPSLSEQAYAEAATKPTGLAGYNNWMCFLPDYRLGHADIKKWAALLARWKAGGFGCAMWGDFGYENLRDFTWNLYAYFAEAAWSGRCRDADFDTRFQGTFYGRTLPALASLHQQSAKRRLSHRQSWYAFRLSIQALIRMTRHDDGLAGHARADLAWMKPLSKKIEAAKLAARHEQDHLDHYALALAREINVRERILLAARIAGGLQGWRLRKARDQAAQHLKSLERQYTALWLRHNKPRGIERSLLVYTDLQAGLADLDATPPAPDPRHQMLDMTPHVNAFDVVAAGVPLIATRINQIPFSFHDRPQTFHFLRSGNPLRLDFPPSHIEDIHILYGSQTLDRVHPQPVVEIAVLDEGQTVFVEHLRSISDLCDWWMPLGGSIWSGGGFRHVDQRRNTLARSPGPWHGLFHLRRFTLPSGCRGDQLRFRSLSEAAFRIFAVTLQHPDVSSRFATD